MTKRSSDGLECEADPRFHKREWIVQRISWGFLFLFLIAGGLGFFGGGPVSRAKEQGSRVNVEYERFERHGAQHAIKVSWQVKSAARSDSTLSLESKFLESLELQHVIPEPARTYTADDKTFFVFATDSAKSQYSVTFNVQPRDLGRQTTSVTLGGSDSVRIHQLVYP